MSGRQRQGCREGGIQPHVSNYFAYSVGSQRQDPRVQNVETQSTALLLKYL